MTSFIFPLGLVFVLAILARRFARRHLSFDDSLTRSEAQYAKVIDQLHKEHATALPHEAMAPVVAGVREWVLLYALQEDCELEIEESVLHIKLTKVTPPVAISVRWVLRDAHFSALQRGRRLRKGHWEVLDNQGVGTPFDDLASLMWAITQRLRHEGLVLQREPLIAADDMTSTALPPVAVRRNESDSHTT